MHFDQQIKDSLQNGGHLQSDAFLNSHSERIILDGKEILSMKITK